MSLDYSLEEIKDFRVVCLTEDGEVSQVTTAIIFETIVTGINRITKSTVSEFLWRSKVISLTKESPLLEVMTKDGPTGRDLTLDEVKAHVGLKTNAAPLSRWKFLKMVGNLRQDKEDEKW